VADRDQGGDENIVKGKCANEGIGIDVLFPKVQIVDCGDKKERGSTRFCQSAFSEAPMLKS
jgi:hypothetical protein